MRSCRRGEIDCVVKTYEQNPSNRWGFARERGKSGEFFRRQLWLVRNSTDYRMGVRLECGRCSTSQKPPHSGHSRKSRREDRIEPQEDSRIGSVGKDDLRLLVRPIRLPRQERQALQILRRQDGLERKVETRNSGGVGGEAA